MPAGRGLFAEEGVFHGDASRQEDPNEGGRLLGYWRRRAETDGYEVVESLCAGAQPAGRVLREVYEGFRDGILADLRAARSVDIVLLALHGAMAADGYDDCEGDLLAGIRAVVGPDTVIGAMLDPHCHLTEAMLTRADLLIAMKEYPHTDGMERAAELYDLAIRSARGEIRPVMRDFDCRMIGIYPTTTEPMAGFVRRMKACEGRDGILSVSLGHGFPWGDVDRVGTRVWVVADGDAAKAATLAEQLGREFYAVRHSAVARTHGVDAALDRALALRGTGRPAVLADVADNAGGGAPGDSTFILRRLVERGIGNTVSGCYWDLGAVNICCNAGVGASFDLRIGGKCGPVSGDPVDLRVTVKAIMPDHGQTGLDGGRYPLGTCVWLEAAGGLHLVLASLRSQVFAPDAFTGLGLSLADKDLIVLKSTQHFHGFFAPLAAEILYVATPGAIAPSFADIPYTRRDGNYWPRVADPLGLDG